MKNQTLVSIENLLINNQSEEIVNSPRTIFACKKHGVTPEDLSYISFEKFKLQKNEQKIIPEILKMKWERRESKRENLIILIKECRLQIIENEKLGLWNNQKSLSSKSISLSSDQLIDSSILEKEKMLIEKIKNRQINEMKKKLELEKKNQEIEQNNKKKIEELQLKDLMRQQEFELRKKSREEKRQLKEMKWKKILEEEAKINDQRINKIKVKELIMDEEFSKRIEERVIQNKIKGEEDKNKKEIRRKIVEQNMKAKLSHFDEFETEMNEKEQNRILFMNEMSENKKKEMQRNKLEKSQKILSVKKRINLKLEQKRKAFIDRERKLDEKLKEYQINIEEKREDSRIIARRKSLEMEKIREEAKKREDEKKDKLLANLKKAEERLELQKLIQKDEFDYKKTLDLKKEFYRKKVRNQMEEQFLEKMNKIKEALNTSDQKLELIKQEKTFEMMKKKQVKNMIIEDRIENAKRNLKKSEFKREELKEKLEEKSRKADFISLQRKALIENRINLRREIDFQKSEIFDKFRNSFSINNDSFSVNRERKKYSNGRKIMNTSKINNLKELTQTKIPYVKKSHNLSQTITVLDEINSMIQSMKEKHKKDLLNLIQKEELKENKRNEMLIRLNGQEREEAEKIAGKKRAKASKRIEEKFIKNEEEVGEILNKYNLKK